MATYRITIEQVFESGSERFCDRKIYEKKYEQTVEGDDTIIPAIVSTVVKYISTTEGEQ